MQFAPCVRNYLANSIQLISPAVLQKFHSLNFNYSSMQLPKNNDYAAVLYIYIYTIMYIYIYIYIYI